MSLSAKPFYDNDFDLHENDPVGGTHFQMSWMVPHLDPPWHRGKRGLTRKWPVLLYCHLHDPSVLVTKCKLSLQSQSVSAWNWEGSIGPVSWIRYEGTKRLPGDLLPAWVRWNELTHFYVVVVVTKNTQNTAVEITKYYSPRMTKLGNQTRLYDSKRAAKNINYPILILIPKWIVNSEAIATILWLRLRSLFAAIFPLFFI